jgi:hypothetical protein
MQANDQYIGDFSAHFYFSYEHEKVKKEPKILMQIRLQGI